METTKMRTVYVFTNDSGNFGNPVGIVHDPNKELTYSKRLEISQRTGYSETVFLDNIEKREISIFNPQEEVDFAGHAVLGTYWYFDKVLNEKINELKCKSAVVKCFEDKLHWITTDLQNLPIWNFLQLSTPQEVIDFRLEKASNLKHTVIWSYELNSSSIIRARTFASDWGILEDEANGSGSMLLSSKLQKKIKVIHGKGSEIFAEPKTNASILLGGKCTTKS